MNRSWFRLPFGGGNSSKDEGEEYDEVVNDSGELLPSSSSARQQQQQYHRHGSNNNKRSKNSNSSASGKNNIKQSIISRPCRFILLIVRRWASVLTLFTSITLTLDNTRILLNDDDHNTMDNAATDGNDII